MKNQSTTQANTEDKLRRKRPPFTLIENAVIKDLEISGYALLVYTVLCMHADHEDGTCFPGFAEIGKYSRCSRSTIKRALKELIDYGYVEKETRKVPGRQENDSNLYTITGRKKRGRVSEDLRRVSQNPGWGLREPRVGSVRTPNQIQGTRSTNQIQREEDAASQPHDRSVYHFFEKSFIDANPELFKHNRSAYGKEGPAIRKLEAIAMEKADPLAWAQQFLDTVRRMQRSGDKLYSSWPFLPSVLCGNGILPRVLQEMRRGEQRDEDEPKPPKICPKCGKPYYGTACTKCGWSKVSEDAHREDKAN